MSAMTARRTGWLVRLTVTACVLLIVGTLALAWWQRSESAESTQQRSSTSRNSSDADHCGTATCDVIDTAKAGAETVELLRSPKGKVGKLRITSDGDSQVVDVSITRLGVPLRDDALVCSSGDSRACLVTGPYASGVVGEVFVARGGSWDSVAEPYFSNAGEIALDGVVDGQSPSVIVVQHDCGADTDLDSCGEVPVLAKVYGLGGKVQGCTQDYPSPARIPGWPEIDLTGDDLRSCD